MQLSIVRKAVLEHVHSSSGVEVVDGMIYILSDDSSFLYKIKYDLTLLEKIPLYPTSAANPEKIAKPEKADLECMGQFLINGFKHLLLLGSGSKSPQRDKAFLIKLPTNYNRKHLVWETDVHKLYTLLRSNEEITANGEINLEGLAFGDDQVYLFNRANEAGSHNVVLCFDKTEFVEYIQGHTEGVPFPVIHPVELPSLAGIQTGFSGADFYDNRLWFVCSAEDTPNAYDDGEVAGSMAGLLEISRDMTSRIPRNKITLDQFSSFSEDSKLYPGKIESISVYEKDQEGVYTAIAVTDNDGKASELLLLDIRI